MSKGQCSRPLLVRGDVVSFEMEDGSTIELPGDWGIIHDPDGDCIPRCTLMLAPYRVTNSRPVSVPQSTVEVAKDYFGSELPLYDAELVIPSGPWDRVGRVVRIYYDRHGNLKGPYQHPFSEFAPAVILSKQRSSQSYPGGTRSKAYRLALPDECVIDEHGFVWP